MTQPAKPAALAETPEQLERLFRDKPDCWEIAGFGSVLVQRRNKLGPLVEAHRAKVSSPSGRRIASRYELEALYREVDARITRTQVEVYDAMLAPSFRRVFGDHDLYDDQPTPNEVTAAATLVTDFYRANLVIARETRGVGAPDAYVEVIDDMARLVDRPLSDVDRFITAIVGFIAVIPTFAWQESDATEFHTLALNIGSDDALEDRISQQLKRLRQPWRRWFQ
jgi:hypothetical protein